MGGAVARQPKNVPAEMFFFFHLFFFSFLNCTPSGCFHHVFVDIPSAYVLYTHARTYRHVHIGGPAIPLSTPLFVEAPQRRPLLVPIRSTCHDRHDRVRDKAPYTNTCYCPLLTNLAPHVGGGVQIGDMLLNTNGTIESEQMKRMEAALATLTSGYANLTSEVAALKQEKTALVAQVVALETEAAAASGTSSSELAAVKADLVSLAANHTAVMEALRSNTIDIDSMWDSTDTIFTLQVYGGAQAFMNDKMRAKIAGLRTIRRLRVELEGPVDVADLNELVQDLEIIDNLELDHSSPGKGFAQGKVVFQNLRVLGNFILKVNQNDGITSLSFPALVKVDQFRITSATMQSIAFPALLFVGGSIEVTACSKLATVSLPALQYIESFNLNGNTILAGSGITVNPSIAFADSLNFQTTKITCSTANGLSQVIAACKKFKPTVAHLCTISTPCN